MPNQPYSQNLTYSLLQISDAGAIFRCNTGNVRDYFSAFNSLEEAEQWINQAIKEIADGDKVEFVVHDAENQLVGLISLRGLKSSSPEFGLWIAEENQGKGFGREVTEALRTWAWENTPAQELIYETERGNIPSLKLAESFGLKEIERTSEAKLIRFVMQKPSEGHPPNGEEVQSREG